MKENAYTLKKIAEDQGLLEYRVQGEITFTVKAYKKPIKHIYFKIPSGENTLIITYPKGVKHQAIEAMILKKMPWILRHVSVMKKDKKSQEEVENTKAVRAALLLRINHWVDYYEPILKVKVLETRIKKMKTRWGTCNIEKKRIWINLAFYHKEEDLLEYIVLHEMLHLIERYHNTHFYSLMDQYMPDWRERRERLNN